MNAGNIGSRIYRPNVQFGESVRDWFSNMKARILVGRPVTNPKLQDPDKLGQGEFTLIDLSKYFAFVSQIPVRRFRLERIEWH